MHLKIGRILFYTELTDLRVTNPDFSHIGAIYSFWGCCRFFDGRFWGTNIESHYAESGSVHRL